MKVILLENIDNLGKKYEVVEVANGYANNYLLKRDLAVKADKKNLNELKTKENAVKAVRAQELEDAKAAKEDLEGKTFTIEKTAGENGKLFGSLTSMDVAELLKDAGYKVDKRDISFEDDVKTVGTVNTQVKLHNDVTANIKVEVKAADKEE